MEQRRQHALQRKAEEEKIRVQEEEKKLKDEMEKRKRDREDLTDKRPLRSTTKKVDHLFFYLMITHLITVFHHPRLLKTTRPRNRNLLSSLKRRPK